MTTTDAVTGAEQIQLAEHRGFALGLKAARDQVVSMKASEGVLDKSTQNLIATSLSFSITKAWHGHPPTAVARLVEAAEQLKKTTWVSHPNAAYIINRDYWDAFCNALAAMETSHE